MNTNRKGTVLTVVIPLFNEEAIFPELLKRLKKSVDSITDNYHLLFVNDGSVDRTLDLLKSNAAQDQHVKYISFSRNFGHQNAIMAGITHAKGDAIVIIDGDLQDPPEIIPALYNRYKEGFHVVYAKRASRKGESFFKKFTAKFFYRSLKKITSIEIPLDTGDFRIISKEVAECLKEMEEKNKFLRGQISWLGFKQTFIEYDRDERQKGETKFTIKKMLKFAFDGITSFSNFPLQIASFLGFFFSIVAFIVIVYAVYSKYILHQVVTGWTSIMISTLFLGGIQLLCIGIIGEYISRIATDVKKRPSFVVEETNLGRSENQLEKQE